MAVDRIDADELAGLRRHAAALRLAPRRDTGGARAGAGRSRIRGRGMDFEEHRAYLPGDEARTIDWRVTARTGRLHVRTYREERERPVLLALDLRPPMWFGTRGCFKSVAAARAAALCAWAASGRGDRVGGLCFGHGPHRETRPAAGRRAVLQLLRTWAAAGPAAPDEAVARSLQRLERLAPVGSLVALFSDFRDFGVDAECAVRRLGRANDLLLGFVCDPIERDWPPAGLYPLAMAPAGHPQWLDTSSARGRAAWQAAFEARRARIVTLAQACGAMFLDLSTAADSGAALHGVFAGRARA